MALPIRNARVRLSQGQLFWREVGFGKPVVLLHSSWSEGEEWFPVVQQLHQEFHCVVPDLLGFGESDRSRKIHHSIELQVECLAEFLDFLKIRQVYLVGHGLGGWIAASYAMRYPNQVERLVLLGAEGIALDSGDRWFWEQWLTRLPILVWLLRSLLPLARLLGQETALQRLLTLHRTLKQFPAACRLLFKRRQAEIRAEQVGDRLDWLKLPILVIGGEQDNYPIAALNRAYSKAPYAQSCSLPGHHLLQSTPEAVAEQIHLFLKNQ